LIPFQHLILIFNRFKGPQIGAKVRKVPSFHGLNVTFPHFGHFSKLKVHFNFFLHSTSDLTSPIFGSLFPVGPLELEEPRTDLTFSVCPVSWTRIKKDVIIMPAHAEVGGGWERVGGSGAGQHAGKKSGKGQGQKIKGGQQQQQTKMPKLEDVRE